ncbi:MAG: DsbA family protein [Nanoarchaeota archaeon]|nr:DsbA family protein [Nanoarchaeota archaeon]MBU1135356.1 DsbA family protein [Nanoarchaeota archaeon]MBU2519720.1 DsbA family protein [Nanoarchaeota archaeon]
MKINKMHGFAIVFAIIIISAVFVTMSGPLDFTGYAQKGVALSNQPSGLAAVTIIEYSDFQCPYCARVVPTINQIKQTYGDKVEMVYKHFPLNFHDQAQKAAEASEAAREQGKFWEMHDKIFENQNSMSVANYKKWAAELGLNTEQFNAALDSGKYAQLVNNDLQEGKVAGVSGTPTFFINGQKLVGARPFSEFKKIIDSELQG